METLPLKDLVTKQIDNKHSIVLLPHLPEGAPEIKIVKHTNGTAIPDDEPVILFRARDYLALPMLNYYRELCRRDGATDFQLNSMDDMLKKFEHFRDMHPDIMKQPGCTRGK